MIRATLAALLIGIGLGWAARTHTADHRYVTALAERHEAEARFSNHKTDQLLRENQPGTKGERNGKGNKD